MASIVLYLLFLTMIVNYTTLVAQNPIQTSDFMVFQNIAYMPSVSYNFIANITGNTITSAVDCARQCSTYTLCQTATYYIQTQTCSIYREKYGLGQLMSVGSQTASTISLNYISPAVTYCASSSLGNFQLLRNQFIYSPNELYAFGVSSNTWGVYNATPNGSIASIFWPGPGSLANGSVFQARSDGDLAIYPVPFVWHITTSRFGIGAPFCFSLMNTGQLFWIDSTHTTVWHS